MAVHTKAAPEILPEYGVSFSIKQCRAFQVTPKATLQWLSEEMGFRRFRLMSYWDEHEKVAGQYDFTQLDSQIDYIEACGGVITMCLGARQPRWPESHWPKWALVLPQNDRYEALYAYIKVVVNRYKSRKCIISWQLENEALNRTFGRNGDFNRARLRYEYKLVKSIDTTRPLIMSTSNSWGIPIRTPRPDIFGFTFYRMQYQNGAYHPTRMSWRWYQLRSRIIKLITGRPCFIHELQAEPWGPKAIWEMNEAEQNKSMNCARLNQIINEAQMTQLIPIDLWGGEWWYWCWQNNREEIAQTVREALSTVH